MQTFKIHFIRHGMAEDPENKICLGKNTDPALTQDGVEELRDLMGVYQYPYAQKLYVSPLLRCKQTADILFPETEAEIMEELAECDLGDFDGKQIKELAKNKEFIGWIEGKNPPPNGETSEEFGNRIACAFDDIVHDMSEKHLTETAVITHGTVIMGLLAMCGYPREEMKYWAVDSGCGYTVRTSVSMWMHDSCFEIIAPQPNGNEYSDEENEDIPENSDEMTFFE